MNQEDKFVLAIVLVHPDHRIDGPYYVANPFQHEPGWGVASVNFELKHLLRESAKP